MQRSNSVCPYELPVKHYVQNQLWTFYWQYWRQWVNDSERASITISWLRDLSIHLLLLPPSSCPFMQSGHNSPTTILSNGYHSFIPSLLSGRHSTESIRKWVYCECPQPRHCRWMARSKPVWLKMIWSPLLSWFCILYLLAISAARCVM